MNNSSYAKRCVMLAGLPILAFALTPFLQLLWDVLRWGNAPTVRYFSFYWLEIPQWFVKVNWFYSLFAALILLAALRSWFRRADFFAGVNLLLAVNIVCGMPGQALAVFLSRI